MQWPALSFNGDWWRTQMRYCSPFIKLTLHIRKLNEFRGDSISVNYTMSWYFKRGGGVGDCVNPLSWLEDSAVVWESYGLENLALAFVITFLPAHYRPVFPTGYSETMVGGLRAHCKIKCITLVHFEALDWLKQWRKEFGFCLCYYEKWKMFSDHYKTTVV